VPPAEAAPAPAAPSEGATRISLSAAEPTWVSASVEGKNVYQGVLQPNQTRELAVDGPLRLVVGNAGGLEMSVNGKPVGPIGPRGQVRIVNVSREGDARIVSPAPKPLVDTIQFRVR
jgi:cytoskeleton protein RodZ